MSMRRLYPQQPDSFEFSQDNMAWAKKRIAMYPEGRQASAVIPLLWRAQEQEGWLTKPAIEHVGKMLDMAFIRVLEVATFYFMFQLQPVGKKAHIQVCGTTPCMLCGSEKLVDLCKKYIAPKPHQISENGYLSWEEVECLGACSNAPMIQVDKDYYEDLDEESFVKILKSFENDDPVIPGPQNGRFSCEPKGGATTLLNDSFAQQDYNASIAFALAEGEHNPEMENNRQRRYDAQVQESEPAPDISKRPGSLLDAPRGDRPDNLQGINGITPELEKVLNDVGVYHYDQIVGWSANDIHWINENLSAHKTTVQDDWVKQAAELNKSKV